MKPNALPPADRISAARADLHAAANAPDVPAMLRGLADAFEHLGELPAAMMPSALQRRTFRFKLLSISRGEDDAGEESSAPPEAEATADDTPNDQPPAPPA